MSELTEKVVALGRVAIVGATAWLGGYLNGGPEMGLWCLFGWGLVVSIFFLLNRD